MRPEIEVVWLIDSDPPSPQVGRGYYPGAPGATLEATHADPA